MAHEPGGDLRMTTALKTRLVPALVAVVLVLGPIAFAFREIAYGGTTRRAGNTPMTRCSLRHALSPKSHRNGGDRCGILPDAYLPGWCATVDGKPAKIFPANLALRAVYLEPGEYHVEFHYEPGSFRAGLVVSGAGVSALAVCLALQSLRRRV